MQISPQPIERYRPLLGDGFDEIEAAAERARKEFSGRTIWHVSSTARGGGVAELLRTLLPYVRGAGVDTRWVVLHEGPEFFALTKRIHNRLHGDAGDGGELGERERQLYESTLVDPASELTSLCRPGDIVYLHDPQTAGLIAPMTEAGQKVVWRCHVGIDEPNDLVREGWDFLRPYVERADAIVFSRGAYRWDGLEGERIWVMPPVIDAFSSKNQELDSETVAAILSRVERRAELLQGAPLPAGVPAVVQVSRWDRLKDPLGVLEMFERYLPDPIHLVLAGPATGAVSDDPEGAAVYEEVAAAWHDLDEVPRGRAHLVSLPMDDIEENGAMVNALQRRATVVLQKSLAEGFGLTVAEAMWKRRPVVASGVGGIRDQVLDGETGLLIDDPHDLEGFAAAIRDLVGDPDRAEAIGEAGRQHVLDHYLAVGRLREYVDLIADLIADSE